MPIGLFDPVDLGPQKLCNRIVVSPMAQYSSVDGEPQNWHVQHWGTLLASGPGLVMIESTSFEIGGYGSPACMALHTDEHERAMKRVVDQVRSIGSGKLGIQVGHNGRKACTAVPAAGGQPLFPDNGGWTTFAPSAIAFGDGWPVPVAVDGAGVARIREGFVQTAMRAARLDLDVIEIHAAHGYLLHTFLSPLANHRTDAYGGSFEKRMRLLREVTHGIRQVWPSDRALGIRVNSHDWVEGGLVVEDMIAVLRALKEDGLDYVSVSAGAITAETRIPAAPGYLAPFAEMIRKGVGLPTMVSGMIYDPLLANEIVATGQSDCVAVARGFLDDPRWVWRAAEALGVSISYPMQYERAHPSKWSGGIRRRLHQQPL